MVLALWVIGGKDQRTDDRWFKVLNIEQQSKKPQNDEMITSIFEIPCSIFCGSNADVLIQQHWGTGGCTQLPESRTTHLPPLKADLWAQLAPEGYR